jgi:hypothetical protein
MRDQVSHPYKQGFMTIAAKAYIPIPQTYSLINLVLFVLFMAYLTTLSVTQDVSRPNDRVINEQ